MISLASAPTILSRAPVCDSLKIAFERTDKISE